MTDATADRGSRPPAGRQVTALVLERDAATRRALRGLVESGGDVVVVGELPDTQSVLPAVRQRQPDVVLIGSSAEHEAVVPAVSALAQQAPLVKVVVLAVQTDGQIASEILRAGAAAVVLVRAVLQELLAAIRTAVRGGSFLSPQIGAQLAVQVSGAGLPRLTPRELEVLELLGRGHTNAGIARLLTLSVRTVEAHRAHLQQKLGAGSRAELIALAETRGLLKRS